MNVAQKSLFSHNNVSDLFNGSNVFAKVLIRKTAASSSYVDALKSDYN